MSNREVITMVLGFGGVSFILFLLFYGLTALSYQKIFKAYGYEHPGYAWIPFYRLYILADLTCGPVFKFGEFDVEKKIFLWWWAIAHVIAFVPFVGNFIYLLMTVVCLGYCHHEGIKKIDPTYNSAILSYISAVFGIILWFLVLPKKVD